MPRKSHEENASTGFLLFIYLNLGLLGLREFIILCGLNLFNFPTQNPAAFIQERQQENKCLSREMVVLAIFSWDLSVIKHTWKKPQLNVPEGKLRIYSIFLNDCPSLIYSTHTEHDRPCSRGGRHYRPLEVFILREGQAAEDREESSGRVHASLWREGSVKHLLRWLGGHEFL